MAKEKTQLNKEKERNKDHLLTIYKNIFNSIIAIIIINIVITICRNSLFGIVIPISNVWGEWILYSAFIILIAFPIITYLTLGMISVAVESRLFSLRSDYFILVISLSILFNYYFINGPFTFWTGSILSNMLDILMIYSWLLLGYFVFLVFNRLLLKKSTVKIGEENSYFYEDIPIETIDEDKLNRAPFAKSIAHALQKPSDTSLTIGIFGEWGSGKSSVYNMVKKLCGESEFHFIDFKPWYFGQNNDDIIRIYLHQFVEEIKKTKGFNPKLAKAIRSYANLLSSIGIRNFGTVISFKDAIEKNFPSKESVKLQDLKKEIEEMLKEYHKKIIVYIDDVDRLDGDEVRMIFKLVRLIADFSNVTYIVALDEDVIKKSLSSIYDEVEGSNDDDAKRYMEKFIQIPIYLPKIDPYHLHELCWQKLSDVMTNIGLLKYYDEELIKYLIKLDFSPRNIIRYINLIQFYLPFLKDEIYPRDLLYLLIIQVNSSELYNFIYKNKDLFIEDNKINEEILNRIPRVNDYKEILAILFPFTSDFNKDKKEVRFNGSHKSAWARDKRICSHEFFNQYFFCGVPNGFLSQETLNEFFNTLKVKQLEDAKDEYMKLIDHYSVVELNGKIENRIIDIQDQKEKFLRILQISHRELYSKINRDSSVSIISIAKKVLEELVHDGYRFDEKLWDGAHPVFLLNLYNFSKNYFLESSSLDVLRKSVKNGYMKNSDVNFFRDFHQLDARIMWQHWTDLFTLQEIQIIIEKWIDTEDKFEEFLHLTLDNKNLLENNEIFFSSFVATTQFLTDAKLTEIYCDNKYNYPSTKAELNNYIEVNKRRNIGIFLFAKNNLFKFIVDKLDGYEENIKQNHYAPPKQYIVIGSELIKKYGKKDEIDKITEEWKAIEKYKKDLNANAEELREIKEEIEREERNES